MENDEPIRRVVIEPALEPWPVLAPEPQPIIQEPVPVAPERELVPA